MSMKKGLMLLRPVAAIVMLGMGLSGAAHATGFENPQDANVTFTVNAPQATSATFERASSSFAAGPIDKNTLIGTVDVSTQNAAEVGIEWETPVAGSRTQGTMTATDQSGANFKVELKDNKGNNLQSGGKTDTNSAEPTGAPKVTDYKFQVVTLNDETNIPAGAYSASVIGMFWY